MDQDLDEVFLLVDIGRHPERVDHLDGETALSRDPQVVEETCAVVVGAEAPGLFEKYNVRPAASARHDGHILLGADQPLDVPGRHQGEVSHDDECRTVELPERPVDRLVQRLFPDGDERVLVLERVGAEEGGAAPGLQHGCDHVFKHRPGERLPLFLVEDAGEACLWVDGLKGDERVEVH